jgi:hypothetical protein
MVVMLLFLMLGIKETNPHSALLHERFSFGGVFRGLFSSHLWPVYILAFSVAILGTGLGAFNQLLITEQWSYTKQDQGTNIAIGGIINLFLIPCLGLLANKVGRSRVYLSLVIAGIIVNLSMFLYYEFILYDSRPTLIEMVVFGEMLSVIGILTSMSLTPLVYDFIPRNELGTYAAGSGLVTRATNILTTNLMGLFVLGFATMFLGPAGEMARVTLRDDVPKTEIQTVLDRAPWIDPDTGAPLTAAKLTAQPWYATGANLDHGRGYEIRLRNEASAKLREQRDKLDSERGKHKARQSYFANRHRQAEAEAEAAAVQKLTAEIKTFDDQLQARADAFRAQVEKVLGDRLLPTGGEILATATEPAIVATYSLSGRPASTLVEQSLDRLRQLEPSVIDLRVLPAGNSYTLEVSSTNAVNFQTDLTALGVTGPPSFRDTQALRLDLRILEDPLDRHPSPITRLVNRIAAMFTAPATPERRLNALGRNLRRAGQIHHAGAVPIPGDDRAIRLRVIAEESVTPATLYELVVPAAKEQRMTIARPVLSASFAKQQYDFLIGYVAVFVLQLVGLGITFFFLYLVKIGRVRRRGAEEAEAIQ